MFVLVVAITVLSVVLSVVLIVVLIVVVTVGLVGGPADGLVVVLVVRQWTGDVVRVVRLASSWRTARER